MDHISTTLRQAHRSLARIVIKETLRTLLVNTMRGVLFHCDPSYYEAEYYYDIPFNVYDHYRLKKILGCIKGKLLFCITIVILYLNS